MRSRFALVVGGGAIVAYAAGSWASSSLGVLSSTLFDGRIAPPPYRWVTPPKELAKDNEAPLSGTFPLKLGKKGSSAGAFSTDDGQATVVISEGAIPPAPDQESVQVDIDPNDPADFDAPPDGLEITGNVYRVRAAYKPSGEEVTQLVGSGDRRILLVYPSDAGPHKAHTVLFSPDGSDWSKLDTDDSSQQQQVSAPITAFGLFAVAAPPDTGGLSTSAVGVIVVAVILVVLGALVISRNMRRGQARSSRARK